MSELLLQTYPKQGWFYGIVPIWVPIKVAGTTLLIQLPGNATE